MLPEVREGSSELSVSLLSVLGIGDHTFDTKNHQCIWDRTASLAYTLVVSIGLIGCPLVSMALCYLLIFRKIYSTKFNLYQINTDDPSRMKKVWAETVKSCRMLFVIFIIFVLFWTPYAIVIAIDVKDKLPVSVHLFVTMLAHFHSSVNFCVYVTCNNKFRMGVLQTIGCRLLIEKGTYSVSETKSRNSGQKVATVSGSSSNTYASAASKSLSLTPTISNEQD